MGGGQTCAVKQCSGWFWMVKNILKTDLVSTRDPVKLLETRCDSVDGLSGFEDDEFWTS